MGEGAHAAPHPGDVLRVGLALLWLLAPGVALLRRLVPEVDRRALGTLPLALVCGLAAPLILATACALAGASFDVLYLGLWAAAAAGGVSLFRDLVRGRLRGWREVHTGVLSGAIVMFALGLVTTRPLGGASDAIDHLASARAIVERGDLTPNTVFYADGDGATADSRKGPGHALLAALARTAGLDVVDTWYGLRPYTTAGAFVAFAALARALLPSGLALGASLVAFPLVVRGTSVWFLDTVLYPHNLTWLLIWPALGLVVRHVQTGEGATRRVPLLVAAIAAGLHITAPVMLVAAAWCVAVGGLLLAIGDERARGPKLAVLLTIAAAPLLVLRMVETYHPVNPLHTEASEILYFTGFLSLHSPEPMLRRFCLAALGVALLGVFLVRRRAGAPRASLVGLTLGPLFVSLNPVMGGLLLPRIGYLFSRFLSIVPFPVVCGALVAEGVRSRSAAWRLVAALVVVLVLTRVPSLVTFVSASPDEPTPEAWHAGLALVTTHVPPGATVLSDPMTSYALPAYTGRRVVTALDQHSSPSDSTILERLDAVRRALSPARPLLEAERACARYGAEFVLLNPHRGRRVQSFTDVRHPDLIRATRARFDRAPSFREVAAHEGFALYAFAPDTVGENTFRVEPSERVPTTPEDVRVELSSGVGLVGVELPDRVVRGEALAIPVTLRKTAEVPPATTYRLVLRMRKTLEGDAARFAPVDRLYARLLRRGGGPRIEVAANRRTLDGRYPFGIWDVGESYADTVRVVLPEDLEPGRYRVGVRMVAQKLIRNIAVRDLLRPSGGIGYEVGEIEVR